MRGSRVTRVNEHESVNQGTARRGPLPKCWSGSVATEDATDMYVGSGARQRRSRTFQLLDRTMERASAASIAESSVFTVLSMSVSARTAHFSVPVSRPRPTFPRSVGASIPLRPPGSLATAQPCRSWRLPGMGSPTATNPTSMNSRDETTSSVRSGQSSNWTPRVLAHCSTLFERDSRISLPDDCSRRVSHG